VQFAGSGSGSTPHLAGELFNSMARVKMVHVPYRGSGPAMIGLLSGEASIMFLPAINAGPLLKTGRLRALAVTSRERLPAMPELPTISESGVPGYELDNMYGLYAPAGVPPAILLALNREVGRIINSPEVKDRILKQGVEVQTSTPEHFDTFVKSEVARWAKVIKDAGIKAD